MPRVLATLTLAAALACARTPPTAAGRPPLVYVSNEKSNDISVIDTSRDEVVATISVGKRPRGLHLSPDGKALYVAVSGSPETPPGKEREVGPANRDDDGIAVVDLAAGAVSRMLPSGTDPENFDLSPDGSRVYISNEEGATTSVVDVASGTIVASAKVGGEPEGVAVRPDGAVVYVTSEHDSRVTALGPGGEVLGSFQAGVRPRQVLFSRDGARAFVSGEQDATVTVADAHEHKVIATVAIDAPGAKPMGLALAPDGRTLWVANGRGASVTGVDLATLRPVATYATGGARPWGIAITPDGRKLYTANGGSDDVSVIDAATGRLLKRIPAGSKPWGLAMGR
jgi:YVTN family beta-propeller protein